MKSVPSSVALAISVAALLAACSPAPASDLLSDSSAPAAASEATPETALSVVAGVYAIDPNHKSLTFRVQHLGLGDYTLRFRDFDAVATLDPANVANSSVTASVNAASIAADYSGDYVGTHPGTRFSSWEDDLANSTNFLNATEFPAISFTSTAVQATGARTATITGDLTLLGVTRPITLDATLTGEADAHPFSRLPAVGLSATGTFKRSDFGLDHLIQGGIVGDDVSVRIDGDFIMQPPA